MKIELTKQESDALMTALACAAWQASRDYHLISSPTLKKTLMDEIYGYESLKTKISQTMEDQA